MRCHLSIACLLALGLAFIARAEPATRPATTQAVPHFAGQWKTSFGPMTLVQAGPRIEGTYGGANRIAGTLEGSRFVFKYSEPGIEGEGWFELTEADAFTGQWREKGGTQWFGWAGTREIPAVDPNRFTGLWKTSYGRMRLIQTENKVRGVYLFGGRASVQGTVDGRTLKFTYTQPDGENGEGAFELAADGKSFKGTWAGARNGTGAGGNWTGTRILVQPGRVWLVILEAPWERDLEEDEYSYGAMLRAFFARTPHVKVRHRFIHSQADLRKWCEELPFLAEPVVLYISSHGTQDGISCGGKTIGADVLTDCVRDAGNLKLLHFGACTVAGGPVPRKIHEALGTRATFPISGFDRPVDWAASAIVDFTYMDLVLARQIPPSQALEQTRGLIRFAGARGTPGDAIPPTGLTIVTPPVKSPAR